MLQEAVKLRPNSSMGYYLLGIASYKAALDEEAESALQRALETGDPGPAHLVLANVYIRQQKWAAALESSTATAYTVSAAMVARMRALSEEDDREVDMDSPSSCSISDDPYNYRSGSRNRLALA